jgi:hypothetical protein
MRRIINIWQLLLILMTAIYFVADPKKQVSATQGTGTVDELVRQSKYIFRGTVRALGASTISNLPPGPELAVVRVDEVYVAPSTLGDFTGRDITVRVKETPPTSVGQRWVFFTVGWLYAESLAVLEVGRIPFTDDTAGAIRQQIAAAVQRAADQNLTARLNLAALVIVGRVSAVRPVMSLPARRPITEHDPDWREAMITVESTEKGTAQTSVVIIFPNSTDEFWIDSPKFKTEQEGIWILQRDQRERGAPSLRIPGLTALNPLDFQNKDQLERIRRLLKGPQ